MNEWSMIGLLAGGTIAWPVGGTGYKWVRRFLWPAVAAGLLAVSVGWIAGLVLGALIAVNTLPYGEDTPLWLRALVLALIVAPSAILSPVAAAVFVPVAWVQLVAWFALSRRFNWWTWKLWEGAAGFLQAASLIAGAMAR